MKTTHNMKEKVRDKVCKESSHISDEITCKQQKIDVFTRTAMMSAAADGHKTPARACAAQGDETTR